MNIGVLTGNGELFIFKILDEKKLEDSDGSRDIEGFLCNELGMSSEEFNWQVLEFGSDDCLKIRFTEV
jgi:hypothetical protein